MFQGTSSSWKVSFIWWNPVIIIRDLSNDNSVLVWCANFVFSWIVFENFSGIFVAGEGNFQLTYPFTWMQLFWVWAHIWDLICTCLVECPGILSCLIYADILYLGLKNIWSFVLSFLLIFFFLDFLLCDFKLCCVSVYLEESESKISWDLKDWSSVYCVDNDDEDELEFAEESECFICSFIYTLKSGCYWKYFG